MCGIKVFPTKLRAKLCCNEVNQLVELTFALARERESMEGQQRTLDGIIWDNQPLASFEYPSFAIYLIHFGKTQHTWSFWIETLKDALQKFLGSET